MIKTFISVSTLAFVTLILSAPSNADYIVDFTAAGLHPDVSKTINNISMGSGGSSVVTNPSNISFTAIDTEGVQSASVRYDFANGLNSFLGGLQYSESFSLVRFEVAMDTSFQTAAASGPAFSVTGRYFNSGSSTGTTFSTLNFTPSSTPGIQVMYTDRTMGELQTNDIDAVEWTVTYNGAGTIGFSNNLTFGSTAGLIAAPEPTSAAMIGCALVGLVLRRRRKS